MEAEAIERLQEQDRLAWRRVYSQSSSSPIWHPVPFLHEWCEALRSQGAVRVLDAACGDGGQMMAMPDDLQVVGFDQSPEALACAKRHLSEAGRKNWESQEGRVEDMPFFRDGEFDAVIFIDALSMFLDPGNALREMRRVLKPGGSFLLCTFSDSDPTAGWMQPIDGPRRGLFDGGFINVLYTSSELAELLRSAGFDRIEILERTDRDDPHPGFRGYVHRHSRLVATCQKT